MQIAAGAGGCVGVALLGRAPQQSGDPESESTPRPIPAPETADVPRLEFAVVTVDAQGKEVDRRQERAEYRREEMGNGTSLDLMRIPAGEFEMGSPEGEEERDSDEGPQHGVSVPAFWMGKYAVTQAQYEAVMGTNPATRYDAKFVAPNKPVVGVSWNEAVEFCDRLSKKTGREYRLPSEAEWEYACRAGTKTPFHFGETVTTDLANYRGIDGESLSTTHPGHYGQGPKGQFREETTEVGQFPANAFGLYDMHGNVWEWCLDHWHASYQGAPTDGSAWIESGGSTIRMVRGGSWYDYPRYCRSAYRDWSGPDDRSS